MSWQDNEYADHCVAITIKCYLPNMARKIPPRIGSGIVTNTAPTFPRRPRMISIAPQTWMTRRLATCLDRSQRITAWLIIQHTTMVYLKSYLAMRVSWLCKQNIHGKRNYRKKIDTYYKRLMLVRTVENRDPIYL